MRTIGATGAFTLVVPREDLASRFTDAMLPDGVATLVPVMAIENAALAALKSYLEPGETTVGTGVGLRHLAPLGHGAFESLSRRLAMKCLVRSPFSETAILYFILAITVQFAPDSLDNAAVWFVCHPEREAQA